MRIGIQASYSGGFSETAAEIRELESAGLDLATVAEVYTFDDQVEIDGVAGGFSAGGDSGSVIWRSADRAPLGLLFAGSDSGGREGGGVTFANPLATVLSVLDLQWVAG